MIFWFSSPDTRPGASPDDTTYLRSNSVLRYCRPKEYPPDHTQSMYNSFFFCSSISIFSREYLMVSVK